MEEIVRLLESGKLEEARIELEEVVMDDPNNPDILYNLGMCYSEMDLLNQAIGTLKKTIDIKPDFTNAFVALGVAYSRKKDNKKAKEFFEKALRLESENPYALRNLGALLISEKNYDKAIKALEEAHLIIPDDPQTLYGLGLAYKEITDYENADSYLKDLIKTSSDPYFVDLAKELRREIAFNEFSSRGLRMDAVMYCTSAIQYYKNKSLKQIQEVAFEIAMLGRHGLDVNNPDKKYSLKSLSGEHTGLYLVCFMYVGFQRIDATRDIGFELSKEYKAALEMTRLGDTN